MRCDRRWLLIVLCWVLPRTADAACYALDPTGDHTDGIDVIFLASHFYSTAGPNTTADEHARGAVAELRKSPVYDEYFSKFNFWAIDTIHAEDTCRIESETPICDRRKVLEIAAAACPMLDTKSNDQLVVMFDGGTVGSVASRADSNVTFLNTGTLVIFRHEFSHAFARLGDEYSQPFPQSLMITPYPNCAGVIAGDTCEDKWGDLIGVGGVGCFQNCGGSNWYRPVERACLMNLGTSTEFCPVCERHIRGILNGAITVPVITSVSPLRGPPGSQVTIRGLNFVGVRVVAFRGIAANFTVRSETEVTATVPFGSLGVILVATSGGSAFSDEIFQILPSPRRRVVRH